MKTLILIGLIFSSLAVYSQNKFSSIQLGKKYSKSQIKSAINKASWCGYYHQMKNFKINFDDGCIVLLKNKKQLKSEGILKDENCFQSEKSSNKHVYSISKNGMILIRAEKNIKTKTQFKQ